jgi:hypothetical protein
MDRIDLHDPVKRMQREQKRKAEWQELEQKRERWVLSQIRPEGSDAVRGLQQKPEEGLLHANNSNTLGGGRGEAGSMGGNHTHRAYSDDQNGTELHGVPLAMTDGDDDVMRSRRMKSSARDMNSDAGSTREMENTAGDYRGLVQGSRGWRNADSETVSDSWMEHAFADDRVLSEDALQDRRVDGSDGVSGAKKARVMDDVAGGPDRAAKDGRNSGYGENDDDDDDDDDVLGASDSEAASGSDERALAVVDDQVSGVDMNDLD